jgi:hypothetical protein
MHFRNAVVEVRNFMIMRVKIVDRCSPVLFFGARWNVWVKRKLPQNACIANCWLCLRGNTENMEIFRMFSIQLAYETGTFSER